MKRIATLLILSVLLAACNGSKHFTKLGAKQEAAGLNEAAANSYYIALTKNRNNLDAQVGMKKTGQMYLSTLTSQFAKEKSFGSKKAAVYAYKAATDYRDKIANVGIQIIIPDMYEGDFRQVKEAYLSELYEAALTQMENEDYSGAEGNLNEIRKWDASYKDIKELGDIAYLEPKYQAGVSAYQVEHYREAYGYFQQVLSRRKDYKDAKQLSKQALEKGTLTIAILPFENNSSQRGLESRMSAYMLQALVSVKDPFLKVVDRENMEAILQEQKLQLSGVVDNATAVQVGELVGAQAILTGNVLSYSQQAGTLRNKTRPAYEAYQVKKLNPNDGKYYLETQYKAVTYDEYYNSSSCSIALQYKLVSLKTGEIIKTDILTKDVSDEILFGRYSGNATSLVPSVGNAPSLRQADRASLNKILNGRQDLKSSTALSEELFEEISAEVKTSISQVMLQIVP